MGVLHIITETGMFHSACRVTVAGRSEWYGFKPVQHRRPISPGYVDRTDRSADEKYWADFELPDLALQTGISRAAADYARAQYILGVRDCVSFTADVARHAGMTLPIMNMTPFGFLKILVLYNHALAQGRAAGSAGKW